jgi:hypothetical protein
MLTSPVRIRFESKEVRSLQTEYYSQYPNAKRWIGSRLRDEIAFGRSAVSVTVKPYPLSAFLLAPVRAPAS